MTKTFLTYTSIIEALTGLALIAVPARAAILLLETELSGSLEIILAMVGGAAIFSLALGCWLARQNAAADTLVKALLFYNFAVATILLYGALGLGFKGPALWAVIIFHYFQTIVSLWIIQKKPAK
jgi:hypothetical protein